MTLNVEFEQVQTELRRMKENLGNGQNIAWARFPYTKNNLEVVIESIQCLKLPNQYHISYDENNIFVDINLFEYK